MSKQTAVEWLVEKYELVGMLTPPMIERAKAMEREQIESAYKQGRFDEIDAMDDLAFKPVAERYYDETYKGGREGLTNCGPMDPNIKSVTIFDPATGKTYTPETYKGGEQ